MDITVNYYAVIVAAVLNMGIGALWYGPLFGKPWMAIMGITKESMQSMPLKPWQAMAAGLVNSLIIAYVLFHFTATWVSTLEGALMAGFWVWLGFVATTQIGSFLWEGKPLKLFFINGGYSLISYLAMAVILVLWQ